MARWKKTPEETKAKVIELKMNNLELSSHDIEKQLAWTEWEVSSETVCDIINQLAQLGTTEKWTKQIERLDTIISWIEEITAKVVTNIRQKEEHTIADVKALNDIAKNNFERKQLLTGKPTERKSVNIVKDMTDDELLSMLW